MPASWLGVSRSPRAPRPCSRCSWAKTSTNPRCWAAIAAAAHQHQHRILALPATEAAATYAGEHRYADTTTAAAAGADNLQSGRWSVPIGSLIIVERRRPTTRRPVALADR